MLVPSSSLTNSLNSSGIGEVISDNLAELWKVPTVPLPAAHVVVVQLLVQVIQQCYREGDDLGRHVTLLTNFQLTHYQINYFWRRSLLAYK